MPGEQYAHCAVLLRIGDNHYCHAKRETDLIVLTDTVPLQHCPVQSKLCRMPCLIEGEQIPQRTSLSTSYDNMTPAIKVLQG